MLQKRTLKWLVKNINTFPKHIAEDILKQSVKSDKKKLPKRILPELRTDVDYYKHDIIYNVISKETGFDIKTERRFQDIIKWRRLATYFLWKYTSDTLANKGAYIGIDHATVLYHKRIIEAWLEMKDKETTSLVNKFTVIIEDAIDLYEKELNYKPVKQIDKYTNKVIQVYNTIQDAAEVNNIRYPETIKDVCDKRIKNRFLCTTAGGYKWQWE